MKTFLKLVLFSAVLMGVLAVLGGFAAWHGMGHHPDMSVIVNGDELTMGGDFEDFLGAGIGLVVAGVICLFVLPLTLLLGLALPLLIVGGMVAMLLLALFGVGAVLGSPLIIVGLVLYLALRNRQRHRGQPLQTEPRI